MSKKQENESAKVESVIGHSYLKELLKSYHELICFLLLLCVAVL